MVPFDDMSEYRVTVIRKTRYVVLADSAEMAELRVREDAAGLDVIDWDIEVLVEPLTLTPIAVPDEVDVADEDDATPLDATGADTRHRARLGPREGRLTARHRLAGPPAPCPPR